MIFRLILCLIKSYAIYYTKKNILPSEINIQLLEIFEIERRYHNK